MQNSEELPAYIEQATFYFDDFITPDIGIDNVLLFSEKYRESYVTQYRSKDRTTYLVPIDESGLWQERVAALRENEVSIRLLPSSGREYNEEEIEIAINLGAKAYDIAHPYRPRHEKTTAVLFDPNSAVSVVDAMIAAGRDGDEMRIIRQALSRGETPEKAVYLKAAIDLFGRRASGDREAEEILKNQSIGSTSRLADQLLFEGINSAVVNALGKAAVERSIDVELMTDLENGDPEAQQEVLLAWRGGIALARKYNSQALHKGVYTEVHKIGKSIVLVPAIIDTTDFGAGGASGLGYVNVDSGHNLAEMYVGGVLNEKHRKWLDNVIFNSEIAELMKKLNMGANSRSSLLWRGMTTFESDGRPVISVKERNTLRPLLNRDYKMAHYINGLGVNLVLDDSESRDRVEDVLVEPAAAEVTLLRSVQYSQPTGEVESSIAVLKSVELSNGGSSAEWIFGFALGHVDLYEEATGVDGDPDDYRNRSINFGESGIKCTAGFYYYDGGPDFAEYWMFSGRMDDLKQNLGVIYGIIEESTKKLPEITPYANSEENRRGRPNVTIGFDDIETRQRYDLIFGKNGNIKIIKAQI